jgi:hypothetical protein
MNSPTPKNDDDAERDRQNLIVLIVVGALVLIGAMTMFFYKRSSDQFDCYAAGHRNCAPINTNAR